MGRAACYRLLTVLCLPLLISYLFVFEVESAEGGSARHPGHPEGGSGSYNEEQQRLINGNTSTRHLVTTNAMVYSVYDGEHTADQQSELEAAVPVSENLFVGEGTRGPNTVHLAKQGHQSSADSDGSGELSDLLLSSTEDDQVSAADRRGRETSGQGQPVSYPADPSSSRTSAAASSSEAKSSETSSDRKGVFSRAAATGGEQSLTIDVLSSTGEMSRRIANPRAGRSNRRLLRMSIDALSLYLGLGFIVGGTLWASVIDSYSTQQYLSGALIFLGIVLTFINICRGALS